MLNWRKNWKFVPSDNLMCTFPSMCITTGSPRTHSPQLGQTLLVKSSYLVTITQGPEEMCLSLEHQNPSKTFEKMSYFDRVTVSLHILQTANQETEGSQDRLIYTRHFVPRSPFGRQPSVTLRRRSVRQRGYSLRLLIFKMANNKVDLVR